MAGLGAVLLPLGDELYAVGVEHLREVVVAPRITTVPGAPASVLGVFNLRGAILPILDTARLLGREPLDRAPIALVVTCWDSKAALAATDSPSVVDLNAVVRSAESPGASVIHRFGDVLVTMLDIEVLLAGAGFGSHPARMPG
jgi:purine-binding chemotaxis protein CheW